MEVVIETFVKTEGICEKPGWIVALSMSKVGYQEIKYHISLVILYSLYIVRIELLTLCCLGRKYSLCLAFMKLSSIPLSVFSSKGRVMYGLNLPYVINCSSFVKSIQYQMGLWFSRNLITYIIVSVIVMFPSFCFPILACDSCGLGSGVHEF